MVLASSSTQRWNKASPASGSAVSSNRSQRPGRRLKLVLWASQNPKDFYALWAKLLPTDTQTPMGGTTINFVSAIPQSPLDLVTVDSAGKVITLDADLPE